MCKEIRPLKIKALKIIKHTEQKKFLLFVRAVLKLAVQALILAVLLLFLVLFILRWLPLPTSSFMLQSKTETHYQWASWDEISPQLAIAVIAAEDQRFPQHWGLDTVELKKAFTEKRQRKGKATPRGASTITQQVAKNLFLWNGRSYTRKAVEAILAVAIELTWPKKRILEVYLNIAQFGDGVFGAAAASDAFYHLPAGKLNRQQSAMLASVLPRPAISDVNKPDTRLIKKQRWVLKQMKQLGGLNYLKRL